MDNFNTLIPLALEYYDNNITFFNSFINKVKKTETISTEKDTEKNKIIFLDKNDKKILESDYEVAGIFYKKYNIWIWSWAIPVIQKNKTIIARKLLNYALDIDLNNENNKHLKLIKSELITSRSKISSELQLDIYLALISYLSKKKFIYKRSFVLVDDEPDNVIEYYLFIMNENI